jgi:plasmid stabilization system protein ParE
MTRLTLLAVADRDIEQAVSWYDSQRPGLGDAFLAALDEVFEHLRRHPEIYQAVDGPVRRAVLHTFPYAVFYRILPDRLEVVAILHCQTHPRRLAARAEGDA